MKKVVLLLSVLYASFVVGWAQAPSLASNAGWGPFIQGVPRSVQFFVQSIPTGSRVQSANFRILSPRAGQSPVVVASQTGASTTYTLDVGTLPPNPALTMIVDLTYYPPGSTSTVTTSPSHTLSVIPPPITFTADDNFGPVIVGSAHTSRYSVRNMPPGTTKITMYMMTAAGAILDSIVRNGMDTASIVYRSSRYPGRLRVAALIRYPKEPDGGYRVIRSIADSLLPPIVTASAGWGPFRPNVHLINNFSVQGLGKACRSVRWTISFAGRYGRIYRPVDVTVNYDTVNDRSTFSQDMRNLLPTSLLTVTAYYDSQDSLNSTRTYGFDIIYPRRPPRFRSTTEPPFVFGGQGRDTITVDSIPARTVFANLTILDVRGRTITSQPLQAPEGGFLDSAQIIFNINQLPMYTATVRAQFTQDFSSQPVEYNYYIDVRDTTKPFLFADNWGPYVQSDSSMMSIAVTDLRTASTTNVVGRFDIFDTVAQQSVMTSRYIDISSVRRDSMVFWSTDDGTRVYIIPTNFPLSVEARFRTYSVSGSDTTLVSTISHPILMVAEPGTLTASGGFGPFTATRQNRNTFTMTDLPPKTKMVEFRITGQKDPAAVDSTLVAGTYLDQARFTSDMGSLPINSELYTTVTYENGPDNGVTVQRFLAIVPDSLSVTSSAGWGPYSFDWKTQAWGSGQNITGVNPIPTTFTFSKLPAQTQYISAVSIDDAGAVIDSVEIAVPYRIRYDAALSVTMPFPLHSLRMTAFRFRVFTNGGPIEGVTYIRPVQVLPPQIAFTAQLQTPQFTPDTSAVKQGVDQQVDLNVRWTRMSGSGSNLGLDPSRAIDSVRVNVTDCSGSVTASFLIAPEAPNVTNGVLADYLYNTKQLPVSSEQIHVTVYSESLTFPRAGVSMHDTLRMVPFPMLLSKYGLDFPTYRVTDTVSGKMDNVFTISNLGNVNALSDVHFVDNTGRRVLTLGEFVPAKDTVRITVDMNQLDPAGQPYRLQTQIIFNKCLQEKFWTTIMTTVTVPRRLAPPPVNNWVYSTIGWGPFRQGKNAIASFIAQFDPSQFITSRNGTNDILSISVVGQDSTGTDVANFLAMDTTLSAAAALPGVIRFRTNSSNLIGMPMGSSLVLRFVWKKASQAGPTVVGTWNESYPIQMIPFPAQPLTALNGWGPFKQSVSAGGAGPKVMSAPFGISVAASADSMLRIPTWFYDQTSARLDSVGMSRDSSKIIGGELTQYWSFKNVDVAQFPYPNIMRDRGGVLMKMGYWFTPQYTMPTAFQSSTFNMIPRADWLNGSEVTVTGSNGSKINLTVLTPLPTTSFTFDIPLFGKIPLDLENTDGGNTLAFKTKVVYDTTSQGFQFAGDNLNAGMAWKPTWAIGGFSASYDAVVEDGEKADGFEAIYTFEAKDSIPNRSLRVRQYTSTSLTANITGVISFIANIVELITVLGEDEFTGGLVTVKPMFIFKAGGKQMYTLNLDASESSVLQHTGEVLSSGSDDDKKNSFPTSFGSGVSIEGGGGIEVGIALDFIGIGAGISREDLYASGSTWTGPVNNVTQTHYPIGVSNRVWFSLDLSLFFGLIKIDLFRGLLYHTDSPRFMPSFSVFSESWESIFKSGLMNKIDQTGTDKAQGLIARRAQLPPETPYYYSRPQLATNDSVLAMVWTEHTARSGASKVLFGQLDRRRHQFETTAVVASNMHGIHDPAMALLDDKGSAVIAWAQNERSATEGAGLSLSSLLMQEDIQVVVYDGPSRSVKHTFRIPDITGTRADGHPQVVAGADGNSAVVIWNVLDDMSATSSDIMAVRLFKNGDTWEMSGVREAGVLEGSDHDVRVVALPDGEFLAAWANDVDGGRSRKVVTARTANGAWGQAEVVMPNGVGGRNMLYEDIELVKGPDGVMLLASTHERTMERGTVGQVLHASYSGGTWSQPTALDIPRGAGELRTISGDIHADGRVAVYLDVFGAVSEGAEPERRAIVFTGTDMTRPQSWTAHVDEEATTDKNHVVWNADLVTGPDNTYYLVSQELDTIPGNRQVYGNGIAVGANRLNTVLRAFTLGGNGRLRPRPFLGQTTSVADDRWEQLARYTPVMLDPMPNPASDEVSITIAIPAQQHIRLQIVDATGRVVSTIRDESVMHGIYQFSVPVSGLAQGVYVVSLVSEDGTRVSKTVSVVR